MSWPSTDRVCLARPFAMPSSCYRLLETLSPSKSVNSTEEVSKLLYTHSPYTHVHVHVQCTCVYIYCTYCRCVLHSYFFPAQNTADIKPIAQPIRYMYACTCTCIHHLYMYITCMCNVYTCTCTCMYMYSPEVSSFLISLPPLLIVLSPLPW